jgi:nicotinate-nucleotide adenylyltransferase
MRIGIFGGTFNPIHIAHLIVASEVRWKANLDKVIFIPCSLPPHKEAVDLAGGEERMEMIRLAISGNPYFELSPIEVMRGGKSYTIDTLREMRSKVEPDDELFFILGYDMLVELRTWKEIDSILSICRILAAKRPGYTIDSSYWIPPGKEWWLERIDFFDIPDIGISSSEIRRRVRMGMPISYMVPKAVEDYIMEKGLYRAAGAR